MKKIPSLFVRNYEGVGTKVPTYGEIERFINGNKGRFLATEKVTPGCEWVLAGEGVATRKWDGTAILFKEKQWFKRYDAKNGKTPPSEFIPCQEPDPITGHWPGWTPIKVSDPSNRYICEAIGHFVSSGEGVEEGTYEAIGPKIGGNKDKAPFHQLRKHGEQVLMGGWKLEHTFEGLREYFEKTMPDVEGIVFHHPDGRMCKVKRSDFGLPW